MKLIIYKEHVNINNKVLSLTIHADYMKVAIIEGKYLHNPLTFVMHFFLQCLHIPHESPKTFKQLLFSFVLWNINLYQ